MQWPDLAAVAAGFGARSITVRCANDLDAMDDAIRIRRGPLVIDAILDPMAPTGF